MNRLPQLLIIGSAGLLLFVVSQWPTYTIPACIVTIAVIGIAIRFLRPASPASPGTPAKRNAKRRIATALIAAALLLWVLFSLQHR
jgi:hypothetical protein